MVKTVFPGASGSVRRSGRAPALAESSARRPAARCREQDDERAAGNGNVPALAGTIFFCASEPAMAMIGTIIRKRPMNIAMPSVVLYHGVLAERPAKALPLLPVAELNRRREFRSGRAGRCCSTRPVPTGLTTAQAVKPRMSMARTSSASMAIFTSKDWIFLPRYSGVRPTISPAMNTASTTNTSMP